MGTAEEKDRVIRRYKKLVNEKTPWLTMYQLVGEYIRHRKQDFTTQHAEGDFLTDQIFDTKASEANERHATALIGNMWPSGAKTVKLIPSDGLTDNKLNKDYFEKTTRKLTDFMDDPKSALSLALAEWAGDMGAFGTCGIAAFETQDLRQPLSYKVWDVKRMVIDEDKDGFVNVIGAEYEYDAETVVAEYGIANVSDKMKKAYETGDYAEKVKVLIFVEPRKNPDPNKKGNKAMPYAAWHIDLTNGKVMRESGFTDLPVMVSRFDKATGEKYGRSHGIDGMPDILLANAISEALIRATEKQLDPPLGVSDDAVLGNGTVDTSAGGLNVFSMSGRTPTDKPIFPIFTVGELSSCMELRESLRKAIWERYKLDLLLDLNNETRQTLGEAQIRLRIRSEGISSVFLRQEVELFNPLIIRSFNIAFKAGLLGIQPGDSREKDLIEAGVDVYYLPPEIVERIKQGKDVYKIQYISPAKRMMQSEETQGIMTTMQFATEHAPMFPDITLKIDEERATQLVAELTGAPMSIVRDLDTFKNLRQARQEVLAQQAKAETAQKLAATAQSMAQAMTTGQGDQANGR